MSADQRKKLMVLMVNIFIAIGSLGIIIPILPAYLESINQGGTAAGLMIAIFAGAQPLFSPIAGKWTDQYGRRKIIIFGFIGLTFSMFIFDAVDYPFVLGLILLVLTLLKTMFWQKLSLNSCLSRNGLRMEINSMSYTLKREYLKGMEVFTMPRGKELEQLPMSNVAPSAGDDNSTFNRTNLSGLMNEEQPNPSKVGKETVKNQEK